MPERPRQELLTARPNPGPDVVACKQKRLSFVVYAAHHDVYVRVRRVVVIDRHPLEPRAEIVLDLRHQLPRVLGEVHPSPRLGRDDDLPEASIPSLLPGVEPFGEVEIVPLRVEPEAPRALALCARAAQVAALRSPGSASLVPRERDLHEAALLERRRRARERGGASSAPVSTLMLAQLCGKRRSARSRAPSALARDSRRSQAHRESVPIGCRSTGVPLRERGRRKLDAALVLSLVAMIPRLAAVRSDRARLRSRRSRAHCGSPTDSVSRGRAIPTMLERGTDPK